MTKSELIERMSLCQGQLPLKDVELAVKTMLDQMTEVLASGERIEIRGFGSFSLHFRELNSQGNTSRTSRQVKNYVNE